MTADAQAMMETTAAAVLDALSDHAILHVDARVRILWANAGAEQLFGRTRDTLLGLQASVLFDPADRGLLDLGALRSARPGASAGELRLEHTGRPELWVTLSVYPMRRQGEPDGLVLVFRDATSRRRRRAGDRRLRQILAGVQDYALCALAPDGAVTEWNGAAERVLGYKAEEIVGRHFSAFLTPEDRAAGAAGHILASAERRGTHEAEGWRVRKDGGRFWAWIILTALRDEAGELLGFAYVVRDITERRVAQDALRQSEQQFRLLINGVTDHALYMLDPNGIVVSWNAGAERIKGYAANEVVGQHYARFYTETDRTAGLPAQCLQAAATHDRHEVEGWRVRKDGSLFWASAVIHAIKDDSGKLLGFAKITRDITERRQAQLELSRTQERLFHAQKLEALGQLTGGIAHDFNNLLMIVGGQAPILRKAKDQPNRIEQVADMIEAAAERGGALTRQLLSFARRQHLTRSTISVAARLDGFRDILAKALGSSATLSIDLPSSLWPIEVDAHEFELALMNMAVNARDAMPTGGALTIEGENLVLAAGDVDPELAGEFVALRFGDTGQGIPDDVLPKVFDPFFTTKPSDKGTGLGLSQVYGFARQAGGLATISSVLGRGTNVTIFLPRAKGAAEQDAAPTSESVRRNGRVLVVEDNPEVAEVTSMLVEQLGFSVHLVQNPDEAMAVVDSSNRFALVVSDVVMAGPMDGLALAHTLRAKAPDLPILLVSGYAKSFNEVGGAFPILQKPFKLGDLDQAISKALATARPPPTAGKVVRLADVRRP